MRQESSVADTGRDGVAHIHLVEDLYLDLMKRCLTRLLFNESKPGLGTPRRAERASSKLVRRLMLLLFFIHMPIVRRFSVDRSRIHKVFGPLQRWLLMHYEQRFFDPVERSFGRDFPTDAETMIGMVRLDNLQRCIIDVIQRDVPGDLIETGVWRGGAAIFMRAVLKAFDDRERVVWVADSFAGLPKPDYHRYPVDKGMYLWSVAGFSVSVDQVKGNFQRYRLLDDRVRFLQGWFRDTLPNAPIEQLSLLRLDGDMYESTMVALQALYPKLSIGGYVIIDDYYAIDACRAAVDDFRSVQAITEQIERIDKDGMYWKRLA